MRHWIGKILIGLVLFINVQCALFFIIYPERFAPSFELSGDAGVAAVRGIGVLFLMWNVPYGVAFWNPGRYRLSLYEAIMMQLIGLIGETAILGRLPASHQVARASLLRFISFDGGGLILLLTAAWITRQKK